MAIRTDLVSESEVLCADLPPEGIERNITQRDNVRIITVDVVNEKGARAIGRPCGRYITIEAESLLSSPNLSKEAGILKDNLAPMLPKEGNVLVIGLGNENITPDAIGPLVADKILATRHLRGELAESIGLSFLRSVSVLAPGVLGQTGLEAAELIEALKKETEPAAIIAIDALAARNLSRLGCTIQLSNTGISPGSGVQNKRKEISKSTLGVPVIAVGLPTVIDMSSILEDFCANIAVTPENPMMVTPRDIDRVAAKAARLIATGVNLALFPQLSESEIIALTE